MLLCRSATIAPSLTIITKAMRPDEVSDEAVCDLLATMEDAQWRAISLYAKLLRARDASGA